ncbi:MAG: dihydroorotate dehydrogenase electron transfer subunit [Blastocatellia bacterium]|nr:dihydroorotate dehydrogenase electron transfer subunit [Blastocatellia bacterium]
MRQIPKTPRIVDALAVVERNEIAGEEPARAVGSPAGRRYGRLRLRLPRPIEVLPGQFAMLKAHGIHEPLLRRAMAYYRSEVAEDGLRVEFIYQILGRGTQALARTAPGDSVEFLGSLGNTYDIDAAQGREALLVAGGVGSAALFMLAEELLRRDVPVKLFLGGGSRGDLCGIENFVELLSEQNVFSATVDGSRGERGFVTAPLEAHLRDRGAQPTIIYSCGPDPMLHKVAEIAARHDLPAQLSLEAPMACGFGICVGCAVAVNADCPEGFVYKKVCTDGPVFWGSDLHWS